MSQVLLSGNMWEMPDDDDTASEIHFEWISLHNRSLVTPEDIPDLNWQLVPFYGSIHRTWDYNRLDNVIYPDKPQYIHASPVIEGTKIGGLCPAPDFTWFPEALPDGATYLCTLSSITKASHVFPFLNVANGDDPRLKAGNRGKSEFLMFGDIGLMNIFLSPDGTLGWGIHNN